MFDKYVAFNNPQNGRRIYGETGVLEHRSVLLPPASWAALKHLGIASNRTGSEVIEALITLATQARGGSK